MAKKKNVGKNFKPVTHKEMDDFLRRLLLGEFNDMTIDELDAELGGK